MLNRNTALLTAVLMCALPISAMSAGKESKTISNESQQEKVVYHISDSASARLALININNHLRATKDMAKIVVVTNSKGIDFLLADAQDNDGKPYQPTVQDLKKKGVDFRVCNNTLVSRMIDQKNVIAEAQIVPSGVAEIGHLQTVDRYVYLKP